MFPLMIKPVSDQCILNCDYCYYLNRVERKGNMSEETLARMIADYEATVSKPVYRWHGGEPFMRGLDFYRKAVELQGSCAENTIQTSGLMLTEEWCEFLKMNNWLLGVSIDGPDELNSLRGGRANHVAENIEMLKRWDIPYSLLCVVNSYNVDHPETVVDYLAELAYPKSRVVQFIAQKPLVGVDTIVKPTKANAIWAEEYEQFLKIAYLRTLTDHRGFRIGNLESTFAAWIGEPNTCESLEVCGVYLVVEADGSVYPCEYFVSPDWLLGNLHEKRLGELYTGEGMERFRKLKTADSASCEDCGVKKTCHSGCPADRDLQTMEKTPLCETNQFLGKLTKPSQEFFKRKASNEV